jgi:hypothetical protein
MSTLVKLYIAYVGADPNCELVLRLKLYLSHATCVLVCSYFLLRNPRRSAEFGNKASVIQKSAHTL